MKLEELERELLLALYHENRKGRDLLILSKLAAEYQIDVLPGQIISAHDDMLAEGWITGSANRRIEEMTVASITGRGIKFVENVFDERLTDFRPEALPQGVADLTGARILAGPIGQLDSLAGREGDILFEFDPDSERLAPASDRIVKFSDNVSAVRSAQDALSQLSEHLIKGNDVGQLSLDEVEEARREVWILEQAMKQEAVRVGWIEPLAMSSLKWIATKSAEGVVGNLAFAALVALAALFGFSYA